jgi:high-affinity iron transporter
MTRKLIVFLFAFCSLTAMASQGSVENETRMLINLMDYVAKDYPMAVSDGAIISTFEFEEMNEFVATAIDYAKLLEEGGAIDSVHPIHSNLVELEQLIQAKGSVSDVAKKADFVKALLLELNLVSLSPTDWPNMESGSVLFKEQCATCHGNFGGGDGAAGVGLNPPPTNFRDKSIMQGVAPFQAFNTIRLGIPGTGMRAYAELSDTEIWDLAFYIESIQHLDNRSAKPSHELSLEELANLSDEELVTMYPAIDLAAQRSNPSKSSTDLAEEPIQLAKRLLQESLAAYRNNRVSEATTLALNAYLQGVEPIEPQIMASDNVLFQELETNMMRIRSDIKSEADINVIEDGISKATVSLDKANDLLGNGERGVAMTSFIAASILIREGLEAFLIILAILGILKSLEAPRAIKWVHGGWITAVGAGLVGWFFADSLMTWSAASRELMEGLIALFAVIVLLYLGFWLHGKTEASKWKEFVETRIKSLLNSNNMIGLGAFSFIVVFREAFESVLFLSSLTSDGLSSSKLGVFIGLIASAIVISIFAWAMLRWFKRMPISKVFLYSSLIILALAFVLTGQGVHAIQEGGYLDIHSLPINLRIGALGIYPTYETALSQVFILIAILVIWKLSTFKSPSVENK